MLLESTEVSQHLSGVPTPAFIQVEVWTLTGPLQNFDSYLFELVCCRSAAVFGIIVLLMTIFRVVHGPLTDCFVSGSCCCRTSPDNQLSTSYLLDSWYEVLVQLCYV
ncbi:hypothetical protein AMECASPLE_011418 [Ameca splendens]|uniref:Uncharacterized protein n=1 Tax=Ameca splendens TaxID=208324 RepID=A0ABV1A879_9TELE